MSASAPKGPVQGATVDIRGEPLRRSAKVEQERRGMTLTAPWALPWAGTRCPIGTQRYDPVLPITNTPAPTSWIHNRPLRTAIPGFQKLCLGRPGLVSESVRHLTDMVTLFAG